MSPRILFLIAARGGSKGVPGKNLKCIAGLSLVGFKARAALRSSYCTRLVLSSDAAEIRAEGERQGADVPFCRPAGLASDTASSDSVVLHALETVESEEGRAYDHVMLLEPSSPFATPDHLDRAVELAGEHDASLVVGVKRVGTSSRFIGPLRDDGRADRIVRRFADLDSLRRQDMEPEYTMNGGLYLIRTESLRRTGRIYGDPERSWGLVMDDAHSCSIDTPTDLAFAEFLVASGRLDISPWR